MKRDGVRLRESRSSAKVVGRRVPAMQTNAPYHFVLGSFLFLVRFLELDSWGQVREPLLQARIGAIGERCSFSDRDTTLTSDAKYSSLKKFPAKGSVP